MWRTNGQSRRQQRCVPITNELPNPNSIGQLPQQANGSDCGVFMLIFLRHLTVCDKINGPEIPVQYRFPPAHIQGDHLGGRLILLGDIQNASTHVVD